jgi:hypothetical protein
VPFFFDFDLSRTLTSLPQCLNRFNMHLQPCRLHYDAVIQSVLNILLLQLESGGRS